jgi:hypothetical protein
VDSITPQPSGQSAYRLLVHAKGLPVDHSLLVDGEVAKTLRIDHGPQRKIVAYPIRGGDLLILVELVHKFIDQQQQLRRLMVYLFSRC